MASLKRKASTAKDFLALFGARQTPDSVTKARKLSLSASPTSTQYDHFGFNRRSSVATPPSYGHLLSPGSPSGSIGWQAGISTTTEQLASSNLVAISNQIASSNCDPFNSNLPTANCTEQQGVAMYYSSAPEQEAAAISAPVYPDLFATGLPSYFNDSIMFPQCHDSNTPHDLHGQFFNNENQGLQREDSGVAIGFGPAPAPTTPPKKRMFYRTSSTSPTEFCIDPFILRDTNHEIGTPPRFDRQVSESQPATEQETEIEHSPRTEEKHKSDDDRHIRLFSPITDQDELNADISPRFRKKQPLVSKRKTPRSTKKTPLSPSKSQG